jgi:tRNA threonylcarbamoyladenosine biosynthesis protein TsaE
MKEIYKKFIPDESGMLNFGKQLAHALLPDLSHNRILFLYGQLGAGKTTLARGFLFGLGYEGKVKSPTYTLVEPYELAECTIYHFDLYRLHHPQEIESIGVQDYFVANAICLIEWPEHSSGLLPTPDIACHIRIQDDGREIKLVAQTTQGETILQRLQHDK